MSRSRRLTALGADGGGAHSFTRQIVCLSGGIMRKAFGFSLLAVAAVFTLPILANEKPTVEFVDDMKAALDLIGTPGLRSHVPAKDYDAIATDAEKLKAFFDAKMLPFWTQKKSEDAIKFSMDGSQAAAAIQIAARAKDDAAILAGATKLSQTCGDCHATHREQLPGKKYDIK
jgi:hypothetical protein